MVGEDLYIWSVADNDWKNVGPIKGADGQDGEDGEDSEDGQDGKDGSVDIYPPTSEAVNLNDYFTAPAKLHIVAAGATNTPDGATLPAYFSVSISSDATSATQLFWSDDNPKAVYTRVAVITQPEAEGGRAGFD